MVHIAARRTEAEAMAAVRRNSLKASERFESTDSKMKRLVKGY